ncbi:MAG TPA: AAA-like domain-containing protein, partial [Blastocatellia bacterium]|nr:AAA-like domain-containing protein [Blastocatellia bacterium]
MSSSPSHSNRAPAQLLYTNGGPVQSGRGIYIERQADHELQELCRAGQYGYVLTRRQVGKSSLMFHAARTLKERDDMLTVTTDLSRYGTEVTADQWYLGLLAEIAATLRPEVDVHQWWQAHAHFGHPHRFSLFLEEVLLAGVEQRVVIFIDEIQTILRLKFADDFFAAIRAIYNARAEVEEFRRLSFVLIGVANPNELISDPKRTPFNIGRAVELTDFTFEEARPLAEGFGLSSHEARRTLRWVLDWTGGHPFLTQRLCRAIADARRSRWSQSQLADLAGECFLGQVEQDSELRALRDLLAKRPSPAGERAPVNWKRKTQYAAAGLLIALSLTTVPLSVEAWNRKKAAELTALSEREARLSAEQQVRAAETEHQKALRAARSEREAKRIADEFRLEADRKRARAEESARAERLTQQESDRQRKIARSRELAAYARSELQRDPETSFQLAARAARQAVTEQAVELLRETLPQTFLQTQLQGHSGPVYSAAFSPDSRWVMTASADQTARVWEAATGRPMAVLQGHTAEVWNAAFSPDGQRIVTTSGDNTARIWEAATGRPLAILQGHTDHVTGAVFSPDSKRILTSSLDQTARIWEASTGQPMVTLQGHTDYVLSAVFSPDGRQVLTASGDQTAR